MWGVRYALPVPMVRKKNCDFSYAGLKTAVRLAVERHVGDEVGGDGELVGVGREGDLAARADIAACFQRAAVQHLVQRTTRAIEWTRETHPDLTCLVVAGGVASNQLVRWWVWTQHAGADMGGDTG